MSFTGITIAESVFHVLSLLAAADLLPVIMMMRVYAIWGAKREVLAFLIVFNLVRSITIEYLTTSNELL